MSAGTQPAENRDETRRRASTTQDGKIKGRQGAWYVPRCHGADRVRGDQQPDNVVSEEETLTNDVKA